jgi:hypothetical protein
MMEKLAQAGEGDGVHAHPIALYLPSWDKLWYTHLLRRQIQSPYFHSTPVCTLWITQRTRIWTKSITAGAQSIAPVRQNLVKCRGNISAHRRRRELRFFYLAELGRRNDLKL